MFPLPDTDSASPLFQSADGPHFLHEQALYDLGAMHVAGVDEAGRGPLAGPVVAAAVILDPGNIPCGLNDSKKLSAKKRDAVFDEILATANAVSFTSTCPKRIDEINILEASLEAMTGAVRGLGMQPQWAIFDGRDVPKGCRDIGQALIKGDAISLSIAAASIVAKVIRDRMMIHCDQLYPDYGFAGHKGYGSAAHLAAIAKHGPSPLHRMTFAPMKNMV
jgi:ribonuclease HII